MFLHFVASAKVSTKHEVSMECESCMTGLPVMVLGFEKNYACPHTIVHTVPAPIYECGCPTSYLVSCDHIARRTVCVPCDLKQKVTRSKGFLLNNNCMFVAWSELLSFGMEFFFIIIDPKKLLLSMTVLAADSLQTVCRPFSYHDQVL